MYLLVVLIFKSKSLEVGLLGHMEVLFPVFKKISTLFSIAAVLVCIPTNSVRGFPFLHRMTFVGKVISLIFNMLFRFAVTFLPRSKRLLISWLQSPSAVILEPRKVKSVPVSIVSPSICHEVMGLDTMIFIFWMLSFKPAFSLSSFTFMKMLLSSSSFSAIRVVSSAYLRILIFLPATLITACASSSLAFHMMYSA